MADCIGVMNAGSSSIKFAIYRAAENFAVMFRGQVEKIGIAPRLSVADGSGNTLVERELATEGSLPR